MSEKYDYDVVITSSPFIGKYNITGATKNRMVEGYCGYFFKRKAQNS